MASVERIKALRELVKKAGSTRKAAKLIEEHTGVAPTYSAIHKAMQNGSNTTDYIVECYTRDLNKILKEK
jgi:hypothetical protein